MTVHFLILHVLHSVDISLHGSSVLKTLFFYSIIHIQECCHESCLNYKVFTSKANRLHNFEISYPFPTGYKSNTPKTVLVT